MGGVEDTPGLVQASVIGLARVVASEFPTIQLQMVDLDRHERWADQLLAELDTVDAQEEVAWRRGRRFVPRLATRKALERRAVAEEQGACPIQVVVGRRGDLSSLHLRPARSRAPGPGEVRVKIRFAALNFRDVLRALGTFPAEDERGLLLGDEGAGVVGEIGRGVTSLAVGDRVSFCRSDCFRSEMTVPAEQVVRLPDDVGMAIASTMPVAFLTADYALRAVGRLEPGETVLIHAAAGGVGQAAIQVARAVGARIFATAGSVGKRELMEKLGADLVMDSRRLDFADEVRRATGGRGVDVVLNSLAGQAMIRSLALLAPGGRFLELGKRDFIENTKVGLWSLRRSASYHAIDISSTLLADEKGAIARVKRLFEEYSAGRIQPLPYRIFPVARVSEAVRLMGRGGHLGKLVLDLADTGPVRREGRPIPIRSDRTYLVSGGFGGVGLALARWLTERGAKHLALMGRRGPATPAARKAVTDLRASGVKLVTFAGDVAESTAVAELVDLVEDSCPPIAGVFHLAMVLDDVTVAGLSADRISSVLRPKVQGAWNLHRATLGRPLDLFVMFGSAAASVGNPGQANYAAANAALEAFAWHRRALGLPASTLALGVLGEIGWLVEHPELEDPLRSLGILPLETSDLWGALDALDSSAPAVNVLLRADWRRLGQKLARAGRLPGLLSSLVEAAPERDLDEPSEGLREAILTADPNSRVQLVRSFVLGRTARVLGASPLMLDADRPLAEMGLDSLMGVELMLEIESGLGVSLPHFAPSQEVTIDSVVESVVEMLGGGPAHDTADDSVPAPLSASRPAPRLRHLGGHESSPPLYVVHSAGGDLGAYTDLVAALGDDYAIWGIESMLLAGATEEFASIEDMAEAYADLIHAHQSPGSPRVVGFSVGGIIALETARALETLGEDLVFLALIEWDLATGEPEKGLPRLASFLEAVLALAQQELGIFHGDAFTRFPLESRDLAERVANVESDPGLTMLDWLTERGYFRDDVPRAAADTYVRGIAAHVRLLASEREPVWVSAPTLIWTARDGLSRGPQPRDQKDSLTEHHTLPTDHFRIMTSPHVETIAARLREFSSIAPQVSDRPNRSRDRGEKRASRPLVWTQTPHDEPKQ